MKKRQIYLTWDAYRAGFIATAGALEKLYFQENIKIDTIFYLHDKPLTSKNHDGSQAFLKKGTLAEYEKKYKSEDKILEEIKRCWTIGKAYPKGKIKFINHSLKIKSVIDYQSIYNQILVFLKGHVEEIEEYDLHINVSAGTPQMHVVWLMLNSAGYLPPQTKLWASQLVRNKGVADGVLSLTLIKFKPKFFLSEVLASNYHQTKQVLVNPNDTKSNQRQEVEALLKLYASIPKIPILILGERGTGKSTYVKTLIRESYGKENLPFEDIACGTLSENLMRSELFGHAKGAFTGATTDKEGLLAKFEKEGILFLDEIHDLSKSLQRQLIQVLQTGEYYPVGAEKKKKTMPRIIIASNYPYNTLRDEILDADFFDRVARFVLEVPPLRECKEDLENYWTKTWKTLADFESAPKLIWNQQVETYLHKAELSGNFRDLQKLASYVIAFKLREKNTKKAFELAIEQYEKWASKPAFQEHKNDNPYLIKGATYKTLVDKFNYDVATWAKEYYGGLEAAAKILDRGGSTLYQDIRTGKTK